jgi:hypothetical protein
MASRCRATLPERGSGKVQAEHKSDEFELGEGELAVAGGENGAATWRRITAAVTQLENKTPFGKGPLSAARI